MYELIICFVLFVIVFYDRTSNYIHNVKENLEDTRYKFFNLCDVID